MAAEDSDEARVLLVRREQGPTPIYDSICISYTLFGIDQECQASTKIYPTSLFRSQTSFSPIHTWNLPKKQAG